MKIKKYIFIAFTLAVLFSCGVAKRPVAPVPVTDKIGVADGDYSPATMASYLYTEGIKNNVMGGDPKRSVELFNKVLEIDSLHAPTYYELAELSMQTPEKALNYLRKANAIDSANTWYKTSLARGYIAVQKYDSALLVFNKLIEMAPDNPMNYQMLAALYREQKQPYTAIAVLDSAEVKFGANPELTGFKRQLLVEAGLYDRAVEETEQMLGNAVYDIENYRTLGELYAQIGNDSLAIANFNKARSIDPNDIETIISLNDYYKSKNDNLNFLLTAKQIFLSDDIPVDVKIGFFEDITRSDNYYVENFLQINELITALATKYPNEFKVLKLYVRHLARTGNRENALSLYKNNIGDSVNNREILTTIIDIEAVMNRPDSVAKYAGIALEYFPNDADLYMRKASVVSYFLKNYKEADADYKLALKYAEGDSMRSVIYGSLGDNCYAQGKMKQCFNYYEKALALDTTNAMIYNNYSYFLSTSDKSLDRALAMAEKAVKYSPGNPTYLDTYAWALYKLGRYEEAKNIMRQAVSLDSRGNKELFFHYGDILYALKDYFMAEIYWKKAEESGYDSSEVEQRLKLIEDKK